MSNKVFYQTKEIEKIINADGTETVKQKEKTNLVQRNAEPDYIKIYTKMWFDFKEIPTCWVNLFIQLAIRMTYVDKTDLEHSQIVYTGGSNKEAILKALNIGERQYQYGIQTLTKYHAIKKIRRGEYQINPEYAGKGEWKYNTKKHQGGIEDLVATFKFKEKEVICNTVWQEDDNTVNTEQYIIPTENLAALSDISEDDLEYIDAV